MVISALGEEPDSRDERDRIGERRERKRLDDLVAGALPVGEPGERLPYVVVGKRGHGPIVDPEPATPQARVPKISLDERTFATLDGHERG